MFTDNYREAKKYGDSCWSVLQDRLVCTTDHQTSSQQRDSHINVLDIPKAVKDFLADLSSLFQLLRTMTLVLEYCIFVFVLGLALLQSSTIANSEVSIFSWRLSVD